MWETEEDSKRWKRWKGVPGEGATLRNFRSVKELSRVGETTPGSRRQLWRWHKTRLALLAKDTGEELVFSPEDNREP